MPRPTDTGSGRRSKPAPKPKVTVKDTKGGADLARAKTYAKTPEYRKVVRDVHDNSSRRKVTRTYSFPAYERPGSGPIRRAPNVEVKDTFSVATPRPAAQRKALRDGGDPKKVKSGNVADVLAHLAKTRAERTKAVKHDQAQHDVVTSTDKKRADKYFTEHVKDAKYFATERDRDFRQARKEGKTLSQAATAAGKQAERQKAEVHKREVQKFAAMPDTALAKAVKKLGHKGESSAMFALDQISRPFYALSGAAEAASRGDFKGVKKAGKEGAQLKRRKSYITTLENLGLPKAAAIPLGVAGDVVLDPANLVSLGTATPATVGAKAVGTSAKKLALKAGEDLTAAERKGLEAARAHYDASSAAAKRRGLTLTVGTRRHNVKLNNRLTRATAHAGVVKDSLKATTKFVAGKRGSAGLSKTKQGLKEALVHDARIGGHVMDQEYLRDAGRSYRASRHAADKAGEQRAKAYRKALAALPKSFDREASHKAIIGAIERQDFTDLPTPLRPIAEQMNRELRQHFDAEVAAGIRKAPVEGDVGYFPRYVRDEAFMRDGGAFPVSRPGVVRDTSLQRRSNRGAMEDLSDDQLGLYDLRTDVAMGRRTRASGNMLAAAELNRRLAALSRKLTPEEEGQLLLGTHKGDLADRLAALPKATRARLVVRHGRGFRPLQDKWGEVNPSALAAASDNDAEILLIDPETRHALENMAERGQSTRDLRGRDERDIALHGYDRLQGTLKTLQTVVNPGYHGTNTLGDIWNSRIGGSTVGDLRAARRLAAKDFRLRQQQGRLIPEDVPAGKVERYGDLELSDKEFVELAARHGATHNGFAGQELNALTRGEEVGKAGALQKIRNANEMREDFTRLATFRRALKNGMDPAEAAEWTNKHHFDYGDLTETERAFFRRIFPYWTFMARNTRLQVEGLGRRPGQLDHVGVLGNSLGEQVGLPEDYEQTLAQYEQAGLPIPLPFKGLGGDPAILYPKLPLTDLNNITLDPERFRNNLLSRMSTVIKTAIEQGLEFNTFTRSEFTKDRVPVAVWARPRPIREALNAAFAAAGIKNAIVPIEDRQTGKMVPGWSWRVEQLLRQVPFMSLLSQGGQEALRGRTQDSVYRGIGYGLGPRPQRYVPEEVALSQTFSKANDLRDELESRKQRAGRRPRDNETWADLANDGVPHAATIVRLQNELGDLTAKQYSLSKAAGMKRPYGSPPRNAGKKAKYFGSQGGGSSSKPKYFGAKP